MAEIVLEKAKEPARLRIYIGAAPGVGKTYHMLNDAHLMKDQQGVDVVIGGEDVVIGFAGEREPPLVKRGLGSPAAERFDQRRRPQVLVNVGDQPRIGHCMNRFSEPVNTPAVKAIREISSRGPSMFIQVAGQEGVEPYPFVR